MRVLRQQLDQLKRCEVRLVRVSGDPGIGKTRLLAELAGVARARDHMVLNGRAEEFEQEVPLRPMVEALADPVHERGPALVRQLTLVERTVLARVFPGIVVGEPAASRGDDDGLARYWLFRTLRRVLELISQPQGLVLIIDDVHWADSTSVELLDHVLRHTANVPMLVVVSLRPKQVPPRVASVLTDVPADRVCQIDLGPLDLAQVNDMLRSDVGVRAREWIYEVSGGIPFYVEALARAPRIWRNRLDRDTPLCVDFDDIPSLLRAAVVAEISMLSPRTRTVAEAAAVVGDEFEIELVGAINDMPATEVLRSLDDLAARDVIRPISGSARFRFRHPLMRHCVYALAAPGWRIAAHERAAHYLAQIGAPPVVRAHHLQHSARFGGGAALGCLVDAARTVAGRAPGTAARWLGLVLSLLPDESCQLQRADDLPGRVELMGELARLLAVSGHLREGLDIGRDVLGQLPGGDPAARTHMTLLCAMLERRLGQCEQARTRLLAELDRGPRPEPTLLVRLHLELAYSSACNYRDWCSALACLRDLLTVDSAVPILAAVHGAIREILDPGGSLAGQAPSLSSLIDALDTRDVERYLDVMEFLCWAELFAGRFSDAIRHFDRGVSAARQTGQSYVLPTLLAGAAFAHAVLGNKDEGLACADEVEELARLIGGGLTPGLARVTRSEVWLWGGDYGAAATAAAGPARAGGPAGLVTTIARFNLALAHIGAGDLEAGGAELTSLVGHAQMPYLDPIRQLICAQAMARVEACRNRPLPARAWAERAHAIARRGRLVDQGLAGLAQAYALSLDRHAETATEAARAARLLEAGELRLVAGQARSLAGEALARAGDRSGAVTEFRQAAKLFASCSARGPHAEAIQAQRRLGERVPAAGPKGTASPHHLSRREAEVAELLCAGHTNREIAQKLVLGVRTVETHVRHIFDKLNVTSRAAAASVLSRNP